MENTYWDTEIETMSQDRLRAYQLARLSETVLRAYHGSVYYRRIMDEKGIHPHQVRYLEDLERFPFLNKQIIRESQERQPPLGDLVAVSETEIVYTALSSGSTGVPTASPFTRTDFDEWMDYEARLYWSTGMRPADRYVHAISMSLFCGGPVVLGAQRLGALTIHAGTLPAERLLAIFSQFQPTCFSTTPTYAWHLGEVAQQEGWDPRSDFAIRRIYVSGEPGGSIPATRRAIEELWGAQVFDKYGISDIFGACAGTCTEQDGLHLAEDHVLAEVIEVGGTQPVPEGKPGELVLTSLRKRARPMIRFRTGDIVTITREPCRCGRTHLRLTGIYGRVDDMLVIKGVNVFPSDIESVLRDIKELGGEYEIVITREKHLDQVALRVEAEAAPAAFPVIERQTQERIKQKLGITVKVTAIPVGALPRQEHKTRRVKDLRSEVWSQPAYTL
ncbi:MAG: phenylacetate--CoA ligase [Syntrophomonadaceae bacterium]|nr:phenylacetate--CoA ligase [Syntrophomonadaceae bacterium]